MEKIKLKVEKKKNIKLLDKSIAWTERIKDPIVYLNKKSQDSENSESNNLEYGTDKIKYITNRGIDEVTYANKKIINYGKNKMVKSLKKSRNIKNKITNASKQIKKTEKGIKTAKDTIKTTEKVTKETVKVSKQIFEQGKKLAIEGAKKTVQVSKAIIKGTISAIKAIIASMKSLITAIIAGGWISVIIILIICVFGLICGSFYGIFFSNEVNKSMSVPEVIRQTNEEVFSRIETMKLLYVHDKVEIESSYSNWKEVLAIYAVKYNNGTDDFPYILDMNNIMYLKQIFWDMNMIEPELIQEQNEYLILKNTLHISFENKTKEEIMNNYHFTAEMKNQVNVLLSSANDDLWNLLIYGGRTNNSLIVGIANSEVGNVGGEKFWRWYGFESRVEWCAVFVSWVANEAGVLNLSIPRFSLVSDGIDWFKIKGAWQSKAYVPKPGDIIFFDWENDGKPNHVGIVEKIEDNFVYTIEGNSTNDECKENAYLIGDSVIFGYGMI